MHKSCIRCLLVATAISAGSLSLAAAPSALSSRAFGDDTKKEKKEEDKYTKFFKDKKVETARGKFVTLHKIDGSVYPRAPHEVPRQGADDGCQGSPRPPTPIIWLSAR